MIAPHVGTKYARIRAMTVGARRRRDGDDGGDGDDGDRDDIPKFAPAWKETWTSPKRDVPAELANDGWRPTAEL